MKVLVTGAAGFLGRAFVRHHVAAGDIILGIDDMSAEHAKRPEELVASQPNPGRYPSFQEREVRDWLAHAAAATEKYDVVYHFAAPVGGRVTIEGDPLFNAGSLAIDADLFKHFAKYGNADLIVYPSSSAVYGVSLQAGDGQMLSESDFHPADLTWRAPDEMYGFTKMAGEVLAWKYAGYGHNVLCIRPFSGYGEEQSTDYPVPSIAQRAKRREDPLTVWGSGSQTRDFIHVDDLVGATEARISAGVEGYQSMNVGTGVQMSFIEAAKMMAGLVGYEPAIASDETQPFGVMSRYCNPRMMLAHYKPAVGIDEGFRRVIEAVEA